MKKLIISLLMLFSAAFMFGETIITEDNAEECVEKFLRSGTYVKESTFYSQEPYSIYTPKQNVDSIEVRQSKINIRLLVGTGFSWRTYDCSEQYNKYILDDNNNIVIRYLKIY